MLPGKFLRVHRRNCWTNGILVSRSVHTALIYVWIVWKLSRVFQSCLDISKWSVSRQFQNYSDISRWSWKFPDSLKAVRTFPDDFKIFHTDLKLFRYFRWSQNFLDSFKSVPIFLDDFKIFQTDSKLFGYLQMVSRLPGLMCLWQYFLRNRIYRMQMDHFCQISLSLIQVFKEDGLILFSGFCQ